MGNEHNIQIDEFDAMTDFQKEYVLGMAATEKANRKRNAEIFASFPEEERQNLIVEGVIGSIAILKTTHEHLAEYPYTSAFYNEDSEEWCATNSYCHTTQQAFLNCLGSLYEGPLSPFGMYAWNMLAVEQRSKSVCK